MKTAFVIFETDNYTENQEKSIICVCSLVSIIPYCL